MAKKQPQKPEKAEKAETPADGKSKRPKRYQVLLDPDLAKMVNIIASGLDMSVPDWVNNRLRPIAKKELPEVLKGLGYNRPDA